MVYGERTLQRAESKLSSIHSVLLVNYLLNSLARIGRRYVFSPNDPELLSEIHETFDTVLRSVKNDRGLEGYEIIVDGSNNNASTRNNREVVVDLAIIPVDTMERMFLNATVNSSGATLNNVA